jgi:hypothetical protein
MCIRQLSECSIIIPIIRSVFNSFISHFRAKRIAEMKAAASLNKYGSVIEITAPEYVQEVNKAGDGVNVVLHLYKQG